MKAKYSGKCRLCLTSFGIGAEIISDGDNWYPVDCEGCAKNSVNLTRLLRRSYGLLGPESEGKPLIEIELISGFELGGAYECWGTKWIATLPHIPHHWESTAGWQIGTTDLPMTFKGGSLMDIASRMVTFLAWYNNKEKETPHEQR